MTAIQVAPATTVSAEIVDALQRLVPQLGSPSPPPGAAELAAIVDSPATTLLVARDEAGGGVIVGCLTLVVFRIPTGVRAWIEDVVVDGEARGQGVGEALCRDALRLAQAKGARTVELTSRPSRESANRLYRRLGFQIRETNVYRYSFVDRTDRS